MNILFLTPRDSKTNLGGVEGHVRLLTEESERRGHEVRELSLDEIDGFNKGQAFGYKGQALGSLGYKLKAWGYLWRHRDLFRWAGVIHIHDVFWWYTPFAIINKGLALLRQQGQALVSVTFHGWEGICPPKLSAVIQKRLASWLSNGTIGVGSFYRKWYGMEPDKIVWGVNSKINKGLAFEYKGQALRAKSGLVRRVVFLGRLEEVNGIEVVIEALRKFIGRKDSPLQAQRTVLYRFVFVGDGSYRREAEKFGKVTGMVNNPQKYLAEADVVITSSYMSMLETAAMGKPIIAIANNPLKEDYLDGHPLRNYIEICKNSGELIGRIASFQPRKDAILAAQRWALKQTPERLADVYEELWNLKLV